jgi:hypothetical protein
MKKISDFLVALAASPALQTSWAADPKQTALDFGLNAGQAQALAQAASTDNLAAISNMIKEEEGGQVKAYLWIK